ncbi:MAG: YihY/virulence factor BrkB family protein [Flavobacteriales bacterium]
MAFIIKQLRIIIIVLRNFTKDKLQLQAAGLTYYTLLSVVPVVALIFAIAKGFGFKEALEEQLLTVLKGHEEVAEQIMVFATKMLENAKGGVIAGVGVAILLWSVMRLLVNIELSFNDIWQVKQGRSWIRRFTEYISIMLLAPVMMAMSGGVTVIVSFIESFVEGLEFLSAIGPFIFFLIRVIPYALIWLLFTLLYMAMPNTKVNFGSAFVAGVIAGTAFQLLEWGYINFQVGVSKYNAIYGSFAALPLFLAWVNLSWLITLIGAEVAFANQHVSEIQNEIQDNQLSVTQEHIVALMICKRLLLNYDAGLDPMKIRQISDSLRLPYGISQKVIEHLKDAHLLSEVIIGDGEVGFQPARNFEKMRVSDVLEVLDDLHKTELDTDNKAPFKSYHEAYATFLHDASTAEHNMLLRDMPEFG